MKFYEVIMQVVWSGGAIGMAFFSLRCFWAHLQVMEKFMTAQMKIPKDVMREIRKPLEDPFAIKYGAAVRQFVADNPQLYRPGFGQQLESSEAKRDRYLGQGIQGIGTIFGVMILCMVLFVNHRASIN